MPIQSIFLLLFLFSVSNIQCQQPDTFGKVTPEEIAMTVYSKDSTANAVVLYERGDNYFEVINRYIRVVKEYHVKIKILNEKGYDHASISIPLRRSEKSSEKLKELKAVTHNGKNKTVVLSSQMYTKDVHKFQTERTFTFPNLKKGSILEYKYKIISPYFYHFKGWSFQSDIPKIYSEFNAKIPGNYIYNRAMTGSLVLDINDATVKKNCFHVDGYPQSADCEILKYAMRDIPAFKVAEEYMLAPSNYISRVDFELSKHRRIDGVTDKYTNSWEDVDKEFRADKNIGKQLTKKGFFENHVPESLFAEKDELIRAKSIYAFVQSHYTWTEKYGIYGKARVKEAFDQGKGNVSEINMSLINLLNAAGLKANLMLLSTRKMGLPKKTHPVMSDFNYSIAKLDINGQTYLLDATDKYIAFGTLPFRALNYYGRVMDFKNDSYWYDIKADDSSLHQIRMQLSFDVEENKAFGKLDIINQGYNAFYINEKIDNQNKDTYLESFEEDIESDFSILSYERKPELQDDKNTSERFEFEIENTLNGDMVYFNPFLIRFFEENPFTLEKRTYPVDFGYPRKYKYQMAIEVPEGYIVKEIPKSINVKTGEESIVMKFQGQASQKNIIITFILDLNTPHIPADDYDNLKEVFRHVTDIQNNSLIIFEKI